MASRSHPALAVQSEHVQRGLNSLRRPRVHTPPVLAFRHLSSTPDFANGYAFQGALILISAHLSIEAVSNTPQALFSGTSPSNSATGYAFQGTLILISAHLSIETVLHTFRASLSGTSPSNSATGYVIQHRDCLTHIPSIVFQHLSSRL